ncbi:DUF885 domain-containing protein [Luteococcus sp. Sow4_B9]|uniref:DUF885 domain-containing protein n=1 Tax=Luteococcus sp. Sow4_B9 TaxID=3438792 RepID=UPI003F94A2C0
MSPLALTWAGRPERQDELDDLSPAGLGARDELNRATLARLAEVTPVDVVDMVTIAAMRERLGLHVEMHEQGLDLVDVNNITSSLHLIRESFDQMPRATGDDWRTIARRLRAVPTAVLTWFISQTSAVERDVRPARRQVEALAGQIDGWVAEGGFLDILRANPTTNDGPLDPQVEGELARSIEVARRSFKQAAERLRTEFLPQAVEEDGIGIERYRYFSRRAIGARINLQETYQWGLQEVARLEREERETAERILPGASIREAVDALDADEKYRLTGTDELQAWMQERADEAMDLVGQHFDIPEPVRRIECRIAPTHDGGIYYTGPSEDFSRPGRMWWSVPEGIETFSTWRELSTVYHEGVPGHHLQIGQTAFRADLLNTWRRYGCSVSGTTEGWALYAEWLMAELGHMEDPGNYMGLLDGQMLRAVRVVLDIGLHCSDAEGFEAPEEVGGGRWTFEKAHQYFSERVFMGEENTLFELNRYAGWPGQAPSYKVGERLWMDMRRQVQEARGDDFDLKAFHRTALDIGGVGLDVLQAAVLDLCLGQPSGS